MNILEIKGDEELTLKTITYVYCDDGKAHLVASYVLSKDDYGLEFEGYYTTETARASKTITFNNFRRRFEHYKIFFKGNVTIGKFAE